MTTKTVNLYTFDELSDKAKDKAREWWREYEAQDFGSDTYMYEPIETAAKLLGIEFKTHPVVLYGGGTRRDPCIWWTLHVQGAGASFDATYSYAKGSLAAIKAEFPTNTVLHSIADGLAHLQVRYGYRLSAAIESDSRYHSLEIDLETAQPRDIPAEDIDAFNELFRDFAHWIYKYIDAEYSYRMEDENVDDAMCANEYTFTVDGRRED